MEGSDAAAEAVAQAVGEAVAKATAGDHVEVGLQGCAADTSIAQGSVLCDPLRAALLVYLGAWIVMSAGGWLPDECVGSVAQESA